MKHTEEITKELILSNKLLIIQDIDGVCIPLVKDPLTREINASYVLAASKFKNEFFVLTNGEHEGRRGVNRLIEKTLGGDKSTCKGMYLPGLAAGGIEYQSNDGVTNCPGVSFKEITFLKQIQQKMVLLMKQRSQVILHEFTETKIDNIIKRSVLDTKYSPTINLNGLFDLIPEDVERQKALQIMLEEIMNSLIIEAERNELKESFYLHIAPNLGTSKNLDIIKYAKKGDIGTTDIQLMLNGAIKECGVIVLINKYIENKTGESPLGIDFNVRDCPHKIEDQIKLCLSYFKPEDMPLLVGVGDTITSNFSNDKNTILRGGSDRGFLTLIQELGKAYKKNNKVILVDSSWGEVERPSCNDGRLIGITDKDDPLKFNLVFKDGPQEYISFFNELSNKRNKI